MADALDTMKLLTNEAFLADLKGSDTNRALSDRWGISTSTVSKYRSGNYGDRFAGVEVPGEVERFAPEEYEESSDGARTITNFAAIRDRPVNANDVREWLRSTGDDPASWNYSFRSIAYGADSFSNKMSAWPKTGKGGIVAPPADELLQALDGWEPESLEPLERAGAGFIICPADLQMGKGDYGLTHEDTIRRVMASWERAAAFCREYRPSEILIAELGDSIENINSTSSQRGTNTAAITEQIRYARRVLLEGIKMLAPLTDRLVYAAVPSNHGSVRIGPKSAENHVLDDYGIEIAEQLRDIVAESASLAHVEVIVPEVVNETLCIEIAGTKVGMAHGHQANSSDKLGDFWRGQSHGRMPLGKADIALFGHWHSLRVQQSGDARWLMVSPSSDNGSSWFTSNTGERSKSGMLGLTVDRGEWADLQVF